MKTNKFIGLKQVVITLFSVLLLSSILLNSCKDDADEVNLTPYFGLEGEPTGISADVKGMTQSYVVRSNRPWQIVAQTESDWVKVFPEEGDDDGIIKFTVNENSTFSDRMVNFAFVVDGQEQPVLFRVDQEANVPYITILDAAGITIPAAGGDVMIDVKSNVSWSYSINDDSWLSEGGVTSDQLILLAGKNNASKRTTVLTLTALDYPDVSQSVLLTQSPGAVILEENFSWLAYGNAITYLTTGETRFDNWTPEEQNHGWISTPVAASSDQRIVYARQGFVKLGKTSYGGDLISAKLTDIDGTKTIKVSFKAAGYISAGGTKDDNILRISALGAGEVSVSEIVIDNYPNSQVEDEAGVVNDIWDPAREWSFTITGATAETQIKFLGGDYELKGVGLGKNRIFLDDIKVEVMN